MTILQSWSQGVEFWGRDGIRKLWAAANIKAYGGGVAEAEFLNKLAQIFGGLLITALFINSAFLWHHTNPRTD